MGEQSKGWSAWLRHSWILLVGAAVGVLLILLGNGKLMSDGKEIESKQGAASVETDELILYAETLERKIEALCEGVCGVSDVRAIVTLEGDFTYVYATDSETADNQGGAEHQQHYVTIGNGSSEQAVLLTRTPPTVKGIGIVCRGGLDAATRRELISLLSTAFSIGSNKIYVAEAKP